MEGEGAGVLKGSGGGGGGGGGGEDDSLWLPNVYLRSSPS